MAKIEWKYVSPIKNDSDIDVLEIKYHFALPSDLKKCIAKNNAGMPFPSKFDLGENKGMIFGGLLSFNTGDNDSFFDLVGQFENCQTGTLTMFPFGLDPFGNFYCVKDGKIVFYDHESGSTINICDTFNKFLSMLYE